MNFQAASKNLPSGFIDFNLYPFLSDIDNDTFFTVNAAANFEQRWSYFMFINISDKHGDYNANSYYSEHNIRWQLSDNYPLDLTAQFNFRSGSNNNRQRLGIRWRLSNTSSMQNFFKSLNLFYAINLHAIQFDHEDSNVWQLEHAFMMKFPKISKNLYLSGFMDHTFNENLPGSFPKDPMVAEVQLGYEFIDNLFMVIEYRLNEYRRTDVNNLAAGIQYKINW